MASPIQQTAPAGPDTLITVKVAFEEQNRRFKLALRDLGAGTLQKKLKLFLQIPEDQVIVFERYSDSAGKFVVLDASNPAVYKQLYRAAKAKLKLRLKATLLATSDTAKPTVDQVKRNTYLETVLSDPAPATRSSTSVATTSNTTVIDKVALANALPFDLSKPTIPTIQDFANNAFTIDCNECSHGVIDEHYHCSTCENGDFDLCLECIDKGVSCPGKNHWLIKRSLKNGKIITSTTETLPPKNHAKLAPINISVLGEERTCNGCISQLPSSSMVSCQQCPDFDLCLPCLQKDGHNHHPAHTLAPIDRTSRDITCRVLEKCGQVRGKLHDAICDGCDAQISGIRHKCLSCPDFDLCSKCVSAVREIHPIHRFARIYEELGPVKIKQELHKGIYCDGPICLSKARKTYIRGIRYKCAVCHDTDFCANCEAHPITAHNPSHPLIKIKQPIHQITVSTTEEQPHQTPTTLGDRSAVPVQHASTETTRTSSASAATQVEVRCVDIKAPAPKLNLQAWFESDAIADGMTFAPSHTIQQSWTLRNPGPDAWPAGCAVHFIGGDDMRHVDDKAPSSTEKMAKAMKSNVTEAPLQPGSTATFTVLLKSPSREGRAISYWRLKTADGLPFGHKLWCDVKVVKPIFETVVDMPVKPIERSVETVKPVEPKTESLKSEGSTMIFPKLDKESPASSINDIKQETIVPTEPSIAASEENTQDLLDDIESMTLEDEITDDGFMTDEEYDMLEAEDEA